MNRKNNFLLQLLIVLFTVSLSTSVIPAGIINIHGLFGEVKSSTVTEENWEVTEEISSVFEKSDASKGINVYNIWLYFITIIIFLIFASYATRLPRRETIVTLKIRMDD